MNPRLLSDENVLREQILSVDDANVAEYSFFKGATAEKAMCNVHAYLYADFTHCYRSKNNYCFDRRKALLVFLRCLYCLKTT